MKDFVKVFFLIVFALVFYWGLFLIRARINPFLLSFIGIALAAIIIGGGILLLKNKKP
jgi:hypothetical protein